MPTVTVKTLHIKNYGPIVEDHVNLEDFTYFVGRNNAGKSHYLKALETLLASKAPSLDEIVKLQKNPNEPIVIEADFEGVDAFTASLSTSNHQEAIEAAMKDGILRVVRSLGRSSGDNKFGVYDEEGKISSPTGLQSNLLKILPEVIPISATADTADELKNTQNTALSKLKKEVLNTFFAELREKTESTLSGIDEFLHSEDASRRSATLASFESNLKAELTGEFSEVKPTVVFGLPTDEVISKEMRIYLDDGHKSEIEQKGHGLQRAALIALLRVLAKHGERYRDRPSPLFLIGELESFLHPFAQKQLAKVLAELVSQYQIITTTHSPFIISAGNLGGYRRVVKEATKGSRALEPDMSTVNQASIERHLTYRANMEGLFADRVVLIEGQHDSGFFDRLQEILGIDQPSKFTVFAPAGSKDSLRNARNFYRQMKLDDVSVVADLDYLFSHSFKYLLADLGLDENIPERYRAHLAWTGKGDIGLSELIKLIDQKGVPEDMEKVLEDLSKERIFFMRHGAPEYYYEHHEGIKSGWASLETLADLKHADELEALMNNLFAL